MTLVLIRRKAWGLIVKNGALKNEKEKSMPDESPKPINVTPSPDRKLFYEPPKLREFGPLIQHTNTSLFFDQG